jgi:hypothetical protein
MQGSIDEAIRHYSEALRIEPSHMNARRNLDYLLRKKGEAAEPPG